MVLCPSVQLKLKNTDGNLSFSVPNIGTMHHVYIYCIIKGMYSFAFSDHQHYFFEVQVGGNL